MTQLSAALSAAVKIRDAAVGEEFLPDGYAYAVTLFGRQSYRDGVANYREYRAWTGVVKAAGGAVSAVRGERLPEGYHWVLRSGHPCIDRTPDPAVPVFLLEGPLS